MRRTIGLVAALAVVLPLAAMSAPAGAHGKISKGTYPCYTYTDSGAKDYTGFVLKIRPEHKYTYKRPGKWSVRGRYAHPSKGPKLYWKTGYLHSEATGGHLWSASIGMNVIEILWDEPKGGENFYHCFK